MCTRIITSNKSDNFSNAPLSGNWRTVSISNCDCQKLVAVNDVNSDEGTAEVSYEDTTCSESAFARGRGQKVVGFSFYGDPRASRFHVGKQYFEGIRDNLKMMPEYYPGWVMR